MVTADGLPTVQINGVVWTQVSGRRPGLRGRRVHLRPARRSRPGTRRAAALEPDLLQPAHRHAEHLRARSSTARSGRWPSRRTAQTLYVGGQLHQGRSVHPQPVRRLPDLRRSAADQAPQLQRHRQRAHGDRAARCMRAAPSPPSTAWPDPGWPRSTPYSGALTGWAPDGRRHRPGAHPDRRPDQGHRRRQLRYGSTGWSPTGCRPWTPSTRRSPPLEHQHCGQGLRSTTRRSSAWPPTATRSTAPGTPSAAGTSRACSRPTTPVGDVRWLQDCHGDTYSVAPAGSVIYSVGHAHFCGNIGGFPEFSPRRHQRALAVTKTSTGTVAPNARSASLRQLRRPTRALDLQLVPRGERRNLHRHVPGRLERGRQHRTT